MFPIFDSSMLIVLPAVALAFWAQSRVRSSYQKMSQISSSSGLTGAQVARRILDSNGLHDVKVEAVQGELSDHYDPRDRVVRLSEGIFGSRSLAALGVAAHECGHAIQHASAYAFLKFRHTLLGPANIGSTLAIPMFLIGMFINAFSFLTTLGIVFFSFAVLFHIITLPVEFDASRRALRILGGSGYISDSEISGTRKVLDAAAWTYVASALMAVLQLIQLLVMRGREE
ncbi:MAG: zinc metallopeptidase [bacterium]|nr:zinc metallopeptidase [bacterium]